MMRKLSKQISLAALLSGISGAFVAAYAAPAPVFEPILNDIQQELPEGLQFRLPADLPIEGELYPFVSGTSETELVVSLGATPDCSDPSCIISTIRATSVDVVAQGWPTSGENITPVTVNEGIEGYHYMFGEGDAISQLLMWQQDGLTYMITIATNDLPQEEFIAIARSMASEQPIAP
ncbi:MAG: DUF4367 domain-containing protein [Cyanobacteria bacterium J06638_22]